MKKPVVLVAAMLLAACTDTSPALNPGDGGKTCGAPEGSCATCIAQSCNAEMTACLGASWQTVDDSVCKGLYACTCTCTGADCPATCATKIGGSCATCATTAFGCVQQKCATACSNNGADMAAPATDDGGMNPGDGGMNPGDGGMNPGDGGSLPTDGGSGTCGGPMGGCAMCLEGPCNQQMTACFGSNWKTSDKNSVCEGFYACMCNCKSDGGDCSQSCASKLGVQCATCVTTAFTCLVQSCAQQCK